MGKEAMAIWKWIDKKCQLASILKQIWRVPSLNGHNLDPRGQIDLNSSLMARPLPGLGDGHRNCPKSPSLARVIIFQSIDTKWHFRATFYETVSLFWFSLFLLPTVRILAVFYSYKLNIYLQSIHSSLYLQSNDGRLSTDHTQFTIKRKMLMILNRMIRCWRN